MTLPRTFARRRIRSVPAGAGLMTALSLTAVAAGPGGLSRADRAWGSGPGVMNHPVRVIPSGTVTVPPGWPLDDNGAITCLTCHTEIPTGSEASRPKLRDFESQSAQQSGFCAKCHGLTDRRDARSMHWLALGVAHVPSDGTASRADGGLLDTRTRQCLSCHDGVSAPESTNGTPLNGSRRYMGDKRRNHPIGVQYGGLSRSKDLSPLRPVGLLPQEVALPGGKVGCVSCHNLYAKGRYLLTVPIKGSELCLTCHDMR